MLSQIELERALSDTRFGRPLHFFPSLASTNDEAKRLAEAGAPQGTLVIAEEQTAGRGRAGRTWLTPAGTAIAASFVLRPALNPARLGCLPLLGGLAAARTIEVATGLSPGLKWPNDVWIAGRKVCGVLAESSLALRDGGPALDWAVLGIGINVNGEPPPTTALRHPATTLAVESGSDIDRVALLQTLVRVLSDLYEDMDSPHLLQAVEARLLWRGARIHLDAGATSFDGELLGLSEEGGIRVRTAAAVERTTTVGEISLL